MFICFNAFSGPGLIPYIKQDLQAKLFQKLALHSLPQSFCGDQTFVRIETGKL